MIEPLSVGLWACRKARLRGGDYVLITGAGPIGMLAMKVAFALGVVAVTITDVSPQRLALARQLGATQIVNVAERSLGQAGVQADVLLECCANHHPLTSGLPPFPPPALSLVPVMIAL